MYFIWWISEKTAIYIKLTSFDAENGAERKKSHNYKYWWAVLYGLPIFRVDIHSNLLTDLGRRYMNVLEEIKKIFIDFLYHTPKENLNTEIKNMNIIHKKGYWEKYDSYVVIKELDDKQINKLRIRRRLDYIIIYMNIITNSCRVFWWVAV